MDEGLKTGIGLTVALCAGGWLIGGWPALLPSVFLCGWLWIWELSERRSCDKCQLCERSFKANNRQTRWEYKTIGLCPECISSIFQYSQPASEGE